MTVWVHIVLSVLVRLLLVAYGVYHDEHFIPKYTDVDYKVFTDAAEHVSNGDSPFKRPTYRYTPFLAFLMLPNVLISQLCGKLLFVFFDVATGYLIFQCLRKRDGQNGAVQGAAWWWYNPLCVAVSTRGNAESLMSFSSVATLVLLKNGSIVRAAFVYGLSVHFKLYTAIYSLPIYLSLNNGTSLHRRLLRPSRDSLVFVFFSALAFLVPTALSYQWYGTLYLQEAILHHLHRKDVRHNFSPYFYLLYLTDTWPNSAFLSFVTFLPQFSLLVLLGLVLGTKEHLALCFFSQTFILVAFNKVCTSQYFLWFLCYLPLVFSSVRLTWRQWGLLAVQWILAQALWLLAAYLLEFHGRNTFIYVWMSSLIFMLVNAHILRQILVAYRWPGKKLD